MSHYPNEAGKVIRYYLQKGQRAYEIIHWALGVLSKTFFCYQCHCFYSCKGSPPLRWGGIPCFSNWRLQELKKLVISNTATLRGPVFHANHRFFNQSISRYILIAYYVQRWFMMESPAQAPWSFLTDSVRGCASLTQYAPACLRPQKRADSDAGGWRCSLRFRVADKLEHGSHFE